MAAKKNKAYLGLGHLVSFILAIIPITNVILGIFTRLVRGRIILAILNIFIAPLFYIIDLISVLLNNDLKYLA